MLSGILTLGGTILGTSRDKSHKMPMRGKNVDMTDVTVENYYKNHLDVLVCLGGGGTLKNAYRLSKKGLNIITLPEIPYTIDKLAESILERVSRGKLFSPIIPGSSVPGTWKPVLVTDCLR